MIHKLPDNVVEYIHDSGLDCAVCGDPFSYNDDPVLPDEYDCVWADELHGLIHKGCAEDEIAEMEARQDCEVCVKNGTNDCPGFPGTVLLTTNDCFESRYK